jgi:hypothetical protein
MDLDDGSVEIHWIRSDLSIFVRAFSQAWRVFFYFAWRPCINCGYILLYTRVLAGFPAEKLMFARFRLYIRAGKFLVFILCSLLVIYFLKIDLLRPARNASSFPSSAFIWRAFRT